MSLLVIFSHIILSIPPLIETYYRDFLHPACSIWGVGYHPTPPLVPLHSSASTTPSLTTPQVTTMTTMVSIEMAFLFVPGVSGSGGSMVALAA